MQFCLYYLKFVKTIESFKNIIKKVYLKKDTLFFYVNLNETLI